MGVAAVTELANCNLWLYVAQRVHAEPEAVPVHYNIYFGIDLLGPWWFLYILPAASLLVFLVNLGLSVILYKRHDLAVYFLLLGGLLVQGFASLTAYLLITKI